jgi:hypothetical protein
MSQAVDLDKISQAIHQCLDSYQPGRQPLSHLAAHLERLRADPEWTADEVAQVDRAARRILAVLGDAGWGP